MYPRESGRLDHALSRSPDRIRVRGLGARRSFRLCHRRISKRGGPFSGVPHGARLKTWIGVWACCANLEERVSTACSHLIVLKKGVLKLTRSVCLRAFLPANEL